MGGVDGAADAELPRPGRHKIYFDHGAEALDASYASYQKRVNQVMISAGYEEGKDWLARVFAGAEHSERAWKVRVHIPLEFLLGEKGIPTGTNTYRKPGLPGRR